MSDLYLWDSGTTRIPFVSTANTNPAVAEYDLMEEMKPWLAAGEETLRSIEEGIAQAARNEGSEAVLMFRPRWIPRFLWRILTRHCE